MDMDPIIICVRTNALHWWTYKAWAYGPSNIRGFEMAKAMRDIVLLGTLYRAKCRIQGRI